MSLPRFSVNQSLFINLVSVVIIITGLVVLLEMNREIFPNVSFDMISVSTIYPGATPVDVEKLITVPIEKELKQVDGVKEINSISGSGMSYIIIEIDPDEKNKQQVLNDVQSSVDRVKNLPRDVDDPVVTEITSKQFPIIEVSMSGPMSEKDLQKHADNLEDILEDIDGVARVTKSGYREKEVQVFVDPSVISDTYVSLDEIESSLAQRNISLPAGELNTKTTEYSIRTTGEFYNASDVEDVIIRANDSGNWLRVKDVARVVDGFKDEDIINKTLSTRSINLVILKKESGDALKIVDNVREKSNEYKKAQVDGLQISYVNDYSFFARRRLGVLQNNAWFGVVIVIGILFIFLQKRVAIITFLGVPVSFFATFAVMGMMGITINMISMFGLIIVLGMLVDDGIIVAENIYRYMEEGMSPREAAIKGAEEVMGAVCTAVGTTIAAFAPLLFMTGLIGKFMRDIPIVLITALAASLIEALIILPSHMADFARVKKDASGKPVGLSKDLPWFKFRINGYTWVVERAIRMRYLVILGLTFVLIGTFVLAATKIKFVLFPSAGVNYFFVRGEAPIGTPLAKTEELIKPIEKLVAALPKTELDTYVTSVGQIQEDRHDPFSGQGSHLVQISVYLTPEQDRKRHVDQIIEDLREKTKGIEGFEDLRFDKPQTGPPVGKPVEVKIRGEDFHVLDKIAFEFMDYLKSIDGVSDVTWDHKPGQEEIQINVDKERATMAGLTIQQIAKTVRDVFEGGIATTIKPVKAEEETDVTVRFDKEAATTMDTFDNILVRNSNGNLIPLKKVASVELTSGTTTIHHLDGKRVVKVSSNVDTDKVTSMKVNGMLAKKFADISKRYPGYSVKYGGEQEESIKSLMSLLRAFMFAFLFIYLILASFFKSLIQPLIVSVAIPFGLIGVIFAFYIHGMPLSFLAILGIVGLNGIVVNDSIVLVDFINMQRRAGMERRASIIKAGQMRIRPVILTTITTVGGLSTVAYGIGGLDPFLVPMAMAICWGLLFATVLTLIGIPCIYAILDDIALKITHHSSMIECEKIEECKKN